MEAFSIPWRKAQHRLGLPGKKAGCTMRVCLDASCEPVAHFTLEDGDSVKAAYAYCNLHGFWKTEI
ncbi:MAG: desulfoferrodoxin family protein [Eisenbergiella sp.]